MRVNEEHQLYHYVLITIIVLAIDTPTDEDSSKIVRFIDIYSDLGRAVAKRRAKLGLTQAEVAARIGLTRASLANIETGRQKVLLHHVYQLVDALQLDSLLQLVPPSIAPTNDAEPLKLSTDKVTTIQKAQVTSIVRQALTSTATRRR